MSFKIFGRFIYFHKFRLSVFRLLTNNDMQQIKQIHPSNRVVIIWITKDCLKLQWFWVMVLSCFNLFFYLVGLSSRVWHSGSEFLGTSLLGLTFYSNNERVRKKWPYFKKGILCKSVSPFLQYFFKFISKYIITS